MRIDSPQSGFDEGDLVRYLDGEVSGEERDALARDLAAEPELAASLETLRDIDVFLSPTTRIPALPVEAVDQSLETYLAYSAQYMANTNIGNRLGLCGLSVPCGFTSKGLPIGLLLNGKPFAEATVLRAGYAFEQATDWTKRRPDLSWLT